jgi:hypothetical protein
VFSLAADDTLQTLSLLDEFRAADHRALSWQTPKIHDISLRQPFRVELWDRSQRHVRWVISASSSIAIVRAAFEAAVEAHPHENLTLRNGALVIREYSPGD